MNIKKLLLSILLAFPIIFPSFVFAQEPIDSVNPGDLAEQFDDEVEIIFLDFFVDKVELDKIDTGYTTGETISGVITIHNDGEKRFLNNTIKITLADKVGEDGNPQNFFGEQKEIDLTFTGERKQAIPFSYTLPQGLGDGDYTIFANVYSSSKGLLAFRGSEEFTISGGSRPLGIFQHGINLEDSYIEDKIIIPEAGPVIRKDSFPTKADLLTHLLNTSDKDEIVTPYIKIFDFLKSETMVMEKQLDPITVPASGEYVHSIPAPLFDFTPGVYTAQLIYRDENNNERTPLLSFRYVVIGETLASIESVTLDRVSKKIVDIDEVLNLNIKYFAGIPDILSADFDSSDDVPLVGVGKKMNYSVTLRNKAGQIMGYTVGDVISEEDGSIDLSIVSQFSAQNIFANISFTDSSGFEIDSIDVEIFNATDMPDSVDDGAIPISYILMGVLILIVLLIAMIILLRKGKKSPVIILMFVLGSFIANTQHVDAFVSVVVSGIPDDMGKSESFTVQAIASASVCKNASGWVRAGTANQLPNEPIGVSSWTGWSLFQNEDQGNHTTAYGSATKNTTYDTGTVIGEGYAHGGGQRKRKENGRTTYEYATPASKLYNVHDPINGVCGTTENVCTVGDLNDIADAGSQKLWECLGSYGGTTASCSLTTDVCDNLLGDQVETTSGFTEYDGFEYLINGGECILTGATCDPQIPATITENPNIGDTICVIPLENDCVTYDSAGLNNAVTSVMEGATVYHNAEPSNGFTGRYSYSWSGDPSTVTPLSKTYSTAGTYSVTSTVDDDTNLADKNAICSIIVHECLVANNTGTTNPDCTVGSETMCINDVNSIGRCEVPQISSISCSIQTPDTVNEDALPHTFIWDATWSGGDPNFSVEWNVEGTLINHTSLTSRDDSLSYQVPIGVFNGDEIRPTVTISDGVSSGYYTCEPATISDCPCDPLGDEQCIENICQLPAPVINSITINPKIVEEGDVCGITLDAHDFTAQCSVFDIVNSNTLIESYPPEIPEVLVSLGFVHTFDVNPGIYKVTCNNGTIDYDITPEPLECLENLNITEG